MKQVTIEYTAYQEEVAEDRAEMPKAKRDGPKIPDGSGRRVKRSGTVIDEVEYILSGWGRKMDTAVEAEIPANAALWLREWLGQAYIYHFQGKTDYRVAVIAAIRSAGWDALRDRIEAYGRDNGRLDSVKYALWGKQEDATPVHPAATAAPRSMIYDDPE